MTEVVDGVLERLVRSSRSGLSLVGSRSGFYVGIEISQRNMNG